MLTMTMAGQDSGTWDYMPPEQLDGKAVDIRCDIYALGTVIWEALIGTVPRRGTKLPAAFGEALPADVDMLIGKMVEHDPVNRYQTPDEVLQALHSGAKRVETWKNTKKKAKTISRIALFSIIVAALLVGGWFIGDFVSIAKAKSIYEANKESATITLREINTFSGKLPFFWGRRYIASIKPDLEKQASREQEQMRREFISIKDQVCKHNGSDEELDNRKLLCDNFISKWGKVFDTKETREIIQNQTALDTILIRRKEEKLVADTIAEAQKNTTGKEDAKYRESIESCRRVIALLTLADTKKKLGDYVAELRQEAAGEALGKVKVLLQSDSREDWFTAYQKIDEIRVVIGDEPALLSEQRKIDDKFWAYYYSEAEKAVKEHRFSNARAHIARYERTGMKAHTADAMKANSWIAHSEENFDWEETRKIADGYMKDHAYPPALAALDRFAQKYPDTQVIDIKQQRKTIADNFSAFIVDKREDLDSYQENLKVMSQIL